MADYLPKQNGELATRLNNLALKLPVYATVLNISDPEKTALVTMAKAAHDAVELKDTKWNEYLSEISDAQVTIDAAVKTIRAAVRNLKTNKNYTDAIGMELNVIGGSSSVDPADIKPDLAAQVLPGEVQLKFKKNGSDSVNVYSRRAGQQNWSFVSRKMSSPCTDVTPLAQPNVPEQREYCVRGLLNDDEVGQLSDAVTVVCAG